MVPICSDLQKHDLVALGYLQTDLCQEHFHLPVEDNASIRGRADQMVDQDRDVMAFVNVGTGLAHVPVYLKAYRKSEAQN